VFILLLGAPGSGKGTQGNILAQRLGLPKITTGDLLRAAVKAGTPLGKDAKKYMDKGQLVHDSVILGLIKDELAKPAAAEGAILDGFPRNAAQAELVDRTLAERGHRLTHILLLDVDSDELVRRIPVYTPEWSDHNASDPGITLGCRCTSATRRDRRTLARQRTGFRRPIDRNRDRDRTSSAMI
jgi:adenylate kinase family enzyme